MERSILISKRALALLGFVTLTMGCSRKEGDASDPPDDGGQGGASAAECSEHEDCDDGLFCTVDECQEGECVPLGPRCQSSQICDEDERECLTRCDVEPDADGDGHDAIACGGDDCDDSSSVRYPGNEERCDSAGIDEDCDPDTVSGPRDGDGDRDGYISDRCCNRIDDEFFCGDDCDDERATAFPDANEICNYSDDDCDGDVDEGVTTRYHLDQDGDGFGSSAEEDALDACERPPGYREDDSDCDDTSSVIHPGAYDRCDGMGIDDDCNGTPDDPPKGCACLGTESRSCPLLGSCGASTQQCIDGLWGDCSIAPVEEICGNGEDDDCDGQADENCPCEVPVRFCGTDVGACERGLQVCQPDGSWSECTGGVQPVVEALCDGIDEDCDGVVDEDAGTRCYLDSDGDGFATASATSRVICGGNCLANETELVPTADNIDCDDSDNRAFPRQMNYYDTPRTGVGGYDFNCNGQNEGQTYTAATPFPACQTASGNTGCVSSPTGLYAVPNCGQYGSSGTCIEEDLGSSGFGCQRESFGTQDYPKRKCR